MTACRIICRVAAWLLLALPLSPAQNAAAANTAAGAYQVEVLIFRGPDPLPGEDLSAPAEGRGFNHQLETGATPPAVFRTLDATQMQLGGLASKLRASGAWRVLAHAGWVQSATDWPRHAGLTLEQLQSVQGTTFNPRALLTLLGLAFLALIPTLFRKNFEQFDSKLQQKEK